MPCPYSTLSSSSDESGLNAILAGEFIDINAQHLLESLGARVRATSPPAIVLDVTNVDAIEQPGLDGISAVQAAASAVGASLRVTAAAPSAILTRINTWLTIGR